MTKLDWDKARLRDNARLSVRNERDAMKGIRIMATKRATAGNAAADIAGAAAKKRAAKPTVTEQPSMPAPTAFALVKETEMDLAQAIKAGLIAIDPESISAKLFGTVKFQDFQQLGNFEVCQVSFANGSRKNWVKFAKAGENVVRMWAKSWTMEEGGKTVRKYSKYSNVNGTRFEDPEGSWKTVGRPREMDIRKAAIAVLKAFIPGVVVVDRVY